MLLRCLSRLSEVGPVALSKAEQNARYYARKRMKEDVEARGLSVVDEFNMIVKGPDGSYWVYVDGPGWLRTSRADLPDFSERRAPSWSGYGFS
jgi:hypothetical protein